MAGEVRSERARVFFVPSWQFSPTSCRAFPAVRCALEELGVPYEVKVHSWPWLKSSRGSTSLEDTIRQLQRAFRGVQHVVSMGTPVAAVLVAISEAETKPESLTAAGMLATPATLRSLDMDSLATASAAMFQTRTGSYQVVRMMMADAGEDMWSTVGDELDREIDYPALGEFLKSYKELDLTKRATTLKMPAMFIDTPGYILSGWTDMRDAFLRYVPQAKIETVAGWPQRLHEEASGRAFGRKVVAFLNGLDPQQID